MLSQKLKGQKVWETVANRVTCYRKSPGHEDSSVLAVQPPNDLGRKGPVVQQRGGDAIQAETVVMVLPGPGKPVQTTR